MKFRHLSGVLGFIGLFSLAGANVAQASATWFLVGEHYHSTTDTGFSNDPRDHSPGESYSVAGIRHLVEKGQQIGLDAMIVTEHNSVATCFDPAFLESRLTLICGEEWTTKRSLHIGLLNPPVSTPEKGYFPNDPAHHHPSEEVERDARDLVASVHENAARERKSSLVVVNHPGFGMYMPSDSLGADATEAVVPDYEHPERTRLWWMGQLARGHRMVALAGSDYHACAGWDCVKHGDFFRKFFDEPVNLVLAASTRPDDIMSAMAAGRVVALASPKYKDIRVELDAGSGYGMGDYIRDVKSGEKVSIGIRVLNASGLLGVVYGLATDQEHAMRVLGTYELDSDAWKVSLDVRKEGAREAVHFELFDPMDWEGHTRSAPVALTNPIYF